MIALRPWAVAAAILIREGRLHIDDLVAGVLHSKLTGLGDRASHPPRQTLSPQLNARKDIFCSVGRGWYDVHGPHVVNIDWEIGEALRRLDAQQEQWLEQIDERINVTKLQAELTASREEVHRLQGRLAQIADLCGGIASSPQGRRSCNESKT